MITTMKTKKPELIRIDADAFAHNTKPALVIIEIQRGDIEFAYLASALERLLLLTDTVENTKLYRESVAISVAGYNDDPRELVEIPEVRLFFKRLTEEWPHWLWFLNRDIGAVGLLLSLLCKVETHHSDGRFSTEFADITEVMDIVRELFDRSIPLFSTYGISEDDAVE